MIKMELSDLVTREITINGAKLAVDLNNPVYRLPGNPIITPHDVNKAWGHPALRINTVHNAGAAEHNGRVILLFRSHLRSGRSVLGMARSTDGIKGWEIEPYPAMLPCSLRDSFAEGVDKKALIENEAGGVEDPRITKIGDTYAITYSAYHAHIKNRVRVSLAATKDFRTFTRHGPVLDTDMRNVVIFPEKIRGRYVGLFRPNDTAKEQVGGMYTEIMIGSTQDFMSNSWEISDEPVMRAGKCPGAFCDKIGPGAPPIRTKDGWLSIFHGVRTTMGGNTYVLGAALHDLDDPAKVKVSGIPILYPSLSDCRVKDTDYVHVPNTVFSCGALRKDDGAIIIYYAGCDTVMNVGITHEDVLTALCRDYCQDAKTAEPLYDIRKNLPDKTF